MVSGQLNSLFKDGGQSKTLWIVAGIFILANLGFGVVSGWLSSQKMTRDLASHYSKVAQARAQVLVQPVWVYEFERAQSLIDEIAVDSNIIEAKLLMQRDTLSSSGKSASGPSQTVIAPVTYKDAAMEEQLGRFAVTFSTQEANGELTGKVVESVIISLLMVLVIVISGPLVTRKRDTTAA